jgi:SAM-dependent methyltransferase
LRNGLNQILSKHDVFLRDGEKMSVCLATSWYPRGELPRLIRFLPLLETQYTGIVISLIPRDDEDVIRQFTSGKFSKNPKLIFCVNPEERNGRYLAVKKALDIPADFVHYVDMDRLLHWVETRPEEFKRMVEEIERHDCVIFGRTPTAYLTHPQALIATERISNKVVSHFLNTDLDVSAGSKSFNRSAAQYIADHCQSDNAVGTDAEWSIRLKQAGFTLKFIQVEGLDWESADQFQQQAANKDEQAQASLIYDADPMHWSQRVDIAASIIQAAFEAAQKKNSLISQKKSEPVLFDFHAVFEVDDYLYFYQDELTDERSDLEVNALIRLLMLDKRRKILDLACGFGRHTNRLAKLGHDMTGVDIKPGFLKIARRDAIKRGVNVQYQNGDMRSITFNNEFDYVLLLFTAFGYFSDMENLQVLVNVWNALIPGGKLIFDVPYRDSFLKRMLPFFVVEKEGNLMIDRISFDSLKGRLYNKRIVYRDGIRKDKPFSHRIYNPNEIQELIIQAGLKVEHIYGGWDAQELTTESNRLVVIAQKPE